MVQPFPSGLRRRRWLHSQKRRVGGGESRSSRGLSADNPSSLGDPEDRLSGRLKWDRALPLGLPLLLVLSATFGLDRSLLRPLRKDPCSLASSLWEQRREVDRLDYQSGPRREMVRWQETHAQFDLNAVRFGRERM